MQLAMDRLYEAVSQLDIDIRKQLKQPCTLGAMRYLERLEKARALAYEAQMTLVRLGNSLTCSTG